MQYAMILAGDLVVRMAACRYDVPWCAHVVEQGLGGSSIDGKTQGSPSVDDDREHANPDGDDGYQHEEGG